MRNNRRVIVDLAALVANYRLLAEKCAPAACAAVVKADAYGLGMGAVASALRNAGCGHFFVATVDEAIALRDLLPDVAIYVLEKVATEEIQGLLQASASPVFNSFDEVRSWCAAVQEPRSACVIHIDTGMNRLGMTRRDVERLAGQADLLEALEIRFVMTHLACAEDAAHQRNELQLQRFDELRRLLPTAPTSIANSSGIFLDSRFHGDLTRAGIALFGSNPQPGRPNPMKEVARLQGRIIQVRHVDSPDAVGYGATADVASGSILATVSFGYADGYPRMLGNEASVAVGSSFAPVVGRVSMDTLVIDVSEVPREAAREGCWVDLAGGGINWDNLASQAGTISYELLTRIGPRVIREYLGP